MGPAWTTEEATCEALRQTIQTMEELRTWIDSAQVKLDPVYAQRLRQRAASVRELVEEAWQRSLNVERGEAS
jgi:hypothetical protein